MLQKSTLAFLKKLKKNNDREWMEGHRKEYEAAKEDFEQVVNDILQMLGKEDGRFLALKPRDCIFRLHRDVRFSKNKNPFKTNFGAAFSPGGKKDPAGRYYIHVEPGSSFAGGGIWMPDPEALRRIRQEIDYRFEDFKKIVEKPSFRKRFGELDPADALKKVPKGYEADNPAAEYLKLKHFVTGQALSDEDLCAKNLILSVQGCFAELKPMLAFLGEALAE